MWDRPAPSFWGSMRQLWPCVAISVAGHLNSQTITSWNEGPKSFFSDSENEMLSCQPSGIVMDTLCYPKVSFGLCGMDLSFDISEHRKFSRKLMEIPFWDVTVQKWKNFFLVPYDPTLALGPPTLRLPTPSISSLTTGRTNTASAGWRGWTLTRWDQKVPGFIWVFP